MTGTLTDDEVARVLPILAARARASEKTAQSFRPPRVGIVEEVSSDWHHFVVGRRGVGKSMLLLNVMNHAGEAERPAVYIDVETLRDNPYPDVLLRLLIELTRELDQHVQGGGKGFFARRRARGRLKSLRDRLEKLLADPQETQYSVSNAEFSGGSRSASATLSGGAAVSGAAAAVSAGADYKAGSTSSVEREASYVRTKLQGLQSEAPEFREVLREAVDATGNRGVLIILDDFYFIPRESQPDVLAYLQQVVKNLGIWLKVGAVEHRLNEFEDGNPPRGLQLNQDAGKVAMDVTLADFDHTKSFLESILADVCAEARIDMDRLVSEKARVRLVIASGGVPRDYVNLVAAALDRATRRSDTVARPKNRVGAEDVNVSAPQFLKQKEDDLRVDARKEDVERLRERLQDVLNFCLVHRKTNVFRVNARLLREEQWGRDIAALADLRFFHRFGNQTMKSSDASLVGQRFEGFALDLSSYAATRVRTKNEIDFWTTDGLQKSRAVTFMYSPGWQAEIHDSPNDRSGAPTVTLATEQISIFDALAEFEDDLEEDD